MKPTVTTFYGLKKQVDLWLQIIFTSFLNKFVKCVCFEDAAPTAALYFSLFPAAPGRALSLCECECVCVCTHPGAVGIVDRETSATRLFPAVI